MDTKEITILYVEDDIEDAEILSELLSRCSINSSKNLTVVNTLNEALGKAEQQKFDLVFLDLNLPDSNGVETYKKLAKKYPDLPIIIMTGLNDIYLSRDIVSLGAQDFLVKGDLDSKFLIRAILYAIERKKLDIEIHQSEQKHRILFEKAPDDVILVDRDRLILDCNEKFLQMLCYSKEEVLGKNIKEFTRDEDVEVCVKAFDELDEKSYSEVELMLKTSKGKLIPVWRTINALFNEQGNVNGAIVHSRDITLRKNYEERLESHREHIRLINKILRHDLTNNFAAIKAHTKIYKSNNDPEHLDGIENFVSKSLQLISRMRELESFIETNQDLKVYQVENVIKHIAEKYNRINISISGKANIMADHVIDSIFDNIIGNAIKHGKTDKIDINISDHEKMCLVRISDFGGGIPDDLKDTVFKENYIHGKTGGTGLGLYIVKSAMDRYGGSVFIEDNKPQGTTFVLMFHKV